MTIRVEPFRDDLGPHFEKLNLEWIERHFRVEERDREVLGNPRRRWSTAEARCSSCWTGTRSSGRAP
jgi:hypothetical protein